MGLGRLVLTPLRMAERGLEDLGTLARATQDLPQLERALSMQLSALLVLVGELSQNVERVPRPLEEVAGEIPSIGLRVGALEGHVQRLSGQMARLQASLDSLSATVTDAVEHLPDPDGPGLLGKARDALSSA